MDEVHAWGVKVYPQAPTWTQDEPKQAGHYWTREPQDDKHPTRWAVMEWHMDDGWMPPGGWSIEDNIIEHWTEPFTGEPPKQD